MLLFLSLILGIATILVCDHLFLELVIVLQKIYAAVWVVQWWINSWKQTTVERMLLIWRRHFKFVIDRFNNCGNVTVSWWEGGNQCGCILSWVCTPGGWRVCLCTSSGVYQCKPSGACLLVCCPSDSVSCRHCWIVFYSPLEEQPGSAICLRV